MWRILRLVWGKHHRGACKKQILVCINCKAKKEELIITFLTSAWCLSEEGLDGWKDKLLNMNLGMIQVNLRRK